MKAILGTSLLIAIVASGGGAYGQETTPPPAVDVKPVRASSGIDGPLAETPAAPESIPPEPAPRQQHAGDASHVPDGPHTLSLSDEALARAAALVVVDPVTVDGRGGGGIAWGPLLKQSLTMMVAQHAYRATFEDGTWAETKRGIFWDDYFTSARSLCCWDDGDRFTTNNLFHPMMGSTSVFVFANNHEPSQRTPLGNTRRYWSNKSKAMAYAAVYSAYFEVGPMLSEAAVGNIGLTPGQQTWHDIVITPTVGTALSVGEDLLRVHVIDKVDRRSHAWGIALALLLNPTRSVANAFAGKAPWSAPKALSHTRSPLTVHR